MTSNLARNFLAKHTICEIIWSTIHGNHGYFPSHGCQVANPLIQQLLTHGSMQKSIDLLINRLIRT